MKQLLTIIFSFCISIVIAQDVAVSSTEEYTNQLQNAYWTSVLGQDDSGYYLLREYGPINNTTIVLEKYSRTLKLLYATSIESTSGVMGNSKLHRFTEMNNGIIYIFLEGWNKSKGENSFLVKQVDEDGTIADGEIVLETEPGKNQMKSANYSFRFSPDGSKLAVLTEKPFQKKEKESLRLHVFNTKDFTSIWEQDLTLGNDFERYPVNDIRVDDNGITYLLKDIKISNKEHQYQVITTGNDFSKVSTIVLQGYNLGQKKMMFDSSGNLIIGGTLVPEGHRNTDWQGVWFFKSDNQGNILQNKIEPIGSDLLGLLVSPAKADKEGFVLDNFVLKDVLLKPSGGIVLLTEEQKTSKKAIPNTQPPEYNYTYSYGNAVAISFDSNGNRIWNSVIEKKQEEITMDPKIKFGSFAYQLKDEKLYVVWNFMDLRSDPPLYKYRYWIDRNGNKINIDNLFGKEAYYPTMLTVIDNQGRFEYMDRTFSSLPLKDIQKQNAFRMAVDPSIYFTTDKGMIILSHMPGVESKRYKFNTIVY